jgi:hypothetical protein
LIPRHFGFEHLAQPSYAAEKQEPYSFSPSKRRLLGAEKIQKSKSQKVKKVKKVRKSKRGKVKKPKTKKPESQKSKIQKFNWSKSP